MRRFPSIAVGSGGIHRTWASVGNSCPRKTLTARLSWLPKNFTKPPRKKLADMRVAGFNVHRIQRLAAAHVETVPLAAAEADISANFREPNLADTIAAWREDMHPVVA